jgi:putative membrane protein
VSSPTVEHETSSTGSRQTMSGRSHASIWRGAVVGLGAGLLAAGAMSLAHKGVTAVTGPLSPPGEAGDDATVKVADLLVHALAGRPLPEPAKPQAGTLVHYAFGAGVGALYGGLAERAPRVTGALGLPFGLAVWLGAHVIAVPAAGLAPPPIRRPLAAEASEFVLHLVYGGVTEILRRVGRGRVRRDESRSRPRS